MQFDQKMKKVLFLLICTMTLSGAYAQKKGVLTGTLKDMENDEAVVGAVLAISPVNNPDALQHETSGYGGAFKSAPMAYGEYKVVISLLGYKTLEKTVKLEAPTLDMGTVPMTVEATKIDNVVLRGQAIRTSQKGDTVSYNADAFKVAADADVEGLLSKMPGIKVSDGSVEVQGETIQKVFVDGKEFFGDDVTSAIKSLPAEAVASIEVYNKLSDKAEFTGVDDGDSYKAINIVTRTGMRKAQFGKFYAGYGFDDKYLAGGNLNIFNNNSRLTILALANNINRQDFSFEDVVGINSSGGRGRGGMMFGQQSGISKPLSLGLNYSNSWKDDRVKFEGSYFYNQVKTTNHNTVDRQYFTDDDSTMDYDATTDTESENYNHRFNSKVDWKINDRQALMLRTGLSFQKYENGSETNGLYIQEPASTITENDRVFTSSSSKRTGYNISQSALYRLKLGQKAGRVLTVNGSVRLRDNDNNSLSQSLVSVIPDSTLRQRILNDSRSYSLSGNISYNEPVGKYSTLTADYNISYSNSDADKKAYVLNKELLPYSAQFDPELSNIYNNGYLTQSIGPGYRFNKDRNVVVVNLAYERASLTGDQEYPAVTSPHLKTVFNNVTYFVMSQLYFNSQNSLRLHLRSNTSNPGITQLQDVLDVSNTQFVTSGNPHLKQSYSHDLMAHYVHSSVKRGSTFMIMGGVSKESNTIADSTVMLSGDQEFILPNGMSLAKNGQYTKPVNMSGSWSARAFVNYGTPITFLRSNLNLDFGVMFSQSPSIINGQKNLSKNMGYMAGAVLGSNISENVDFTIAWRGSYNNVENSINVTRNNEYFSQSVSANIKLVLWWGITFAANANYSQYKGITNSYNEQYVICNAFLGKKLFKNQRGELNVGVNDIFNQNKSFSRNVTSRYIENVTNSVIGRYVSINFVYNLRRFGKNGTTDMSKYGNDLSNGGRRYGGPGGPGRGPMEL